MLLRTEISCRDYIEDSLGSNLSHLKIDDLEDVIVTPRVLESFVFANIYEDPYQQEFKQKYFTVGNKKVSQVHHFLKIITNPMSAWLVS